MAVPVVRLVGEERTLKGSYICTCVPLRDIPRSIALYRNGRLPADRLMSGQAMTGGNQRGIRSSEQRECSAAGGRILKPIQKHARIP